MTIISELDEFVDGFKPAGIATNYLDYKFRQIAETTQEFLASMGANFVVMVAEDRPMAFDFVRTDDAAGTIMFQSKLSGGQKVRLAIAFLMAIHETVIPNVGLLMLDEPSMHLDEEGVLQLRELLQELGSRCKVTGTQVIVSDHNPVLELALDVKVML